MKPSRSLVAGIVTVALWASVFPLVRIAVPRFGVFGLTSLRLIVAATVLLVLAPFLRVRLPQRRDLPAIVGCAVLGMFGYQLLLNWGEVSVPAGTSSVIASGAPIVSAAIAILFFGERPSRVRIIGAGVAIAGIAAVCAAESGLSLSASVLIVVAAMFCYGAYHPLVRPLLSRYTGVEVATYCLVAAAVLSLPLFWIALPTLATAGAAAWLAVIYLGLVPTALAFVLWGYALARLPLTTSTSLLFLVPAVAIALAFVLLHEVPRPGEVGGGIIVLLGVALVSRGDLLLAGVASRRRPAGDH